jgi:hypothetical protein
VRTDVSGERAFLRNVLQLALVRTDVSEERTFRRNVLQLDLVGTDVSGEHEFHRSVLRLIIIANAVPNSLIRFTLMESTRSSETSVLTRAMRRHIPEEGILHSHRRENLKSYFSQWSLCMLRSSIAQTRARALNLALKKNSEPICQGSLCQDLAFP